MFKDCFRNQFCLTVFLLLSVNALFGQAKFTTTLLQTNPESRTLLESEVTRYTLFQFDRKALDQFVKTSSKEKSIEFALEIDGRAWHFDLNESSILSPNFKAIERTERGEKDLSQELSISTLSGTVEHNVQNTARMTISEQFMEAFFQYNGDVYFLSPLTRFTKNSKDVNTYIFYKYSDWKGNGSCQNDENILNEQKKDEENNNLNPVLPISSGGVGCGLNTINSTGTTTMHGCRIIQIAADGDFEFFTAWGSAAAATNAIVGAIFASEAGYLAAFTLNFSISSVTIFGGATDTDPYPDNTTGFTTNAAINTFITDMNTAIDGRWSSNPIPHDLVQVFTGVPICNVSTVPGSLCTASGCPNAWQTGGNVCSSTVKNVVGFCVPNFTSVAHEIGHAFGAVHPPNVDCGSGAVPVQPCAVGGVMATIMCPNFCPDRGLAIDAANTTTIATTMTSALCLNASNFGSTITGPELICRNQPTTYTLNIGNFIILQNGITVAWTVGTGLTIVGPTNGASVQVVGNNTYLGPTFVQAVVTGIASCGVTIRRAFYLNGTPPYDCTSYEFCPDEYEEWVVPASIAPGHSITNLHCDSPNCVNLDYYISPSNNIYVYAGSLPGTYVFTYRFTTPCGSFIQSFFVRVYRSCEGQGLVSQGSIDRTAIPVELPEKGLTNFNLRPNPATSSVTVDFSLDAEQVVSLEILNAAGQRISMPMAKAQYAKGDHSVPCPLDGMPKGIYLVKLTTADNVYVRKLATN